MKFQKMKNIDKLHIDFGHSSKEATQATGKGKTKVGQNLKKEGFLLILIPLKQ